MQSLFKMKLNTIEDVKSFVDAANKFNGRITVRNMHYAVDGKSIMGIFFFFFILSSKTLKVSSSSSVVLHFSNKTLSLL